MELVLVPVITYVIAALNTRSSTASFFLILEAKMQPVILQRNRKVQRLYGGSKLKVTDLPLSVAKC